MQKRLIVAMLLQLAACATPSIPTSQVVESQRPIECNSIDQCDRDWLKAQLWLALYSEYQIKNVTYDVIETEVPATNEAKLSFTIIKDSRTGATGGASIWIIASCGSPRGCPRMSPTEAILSFTRYMVEPG